MHQPATHSGLIARGDRVIEGIKVNRVWKEEREGRVYWMKQRRPVATALLYLANGFFRAARAPMRTITSIREWQDLEVQTFRDLHGAEEFQALAEGARAVAAEELPGINLTLPLDSGRMSPEIVQAAGAELRRAHGIHSAWYSGPWSHGDAHAGNFIYEESARRARIIDFEVVHVCSMPAAERHADDVFVFLQDIAGRIHETGWLPCAVAFLHGYGEGEITRCALAKLEHPSGLFTRLWWQIRTGFLPAEVLRGRFDQLKTAWESDGVSGGT